MWSLANGCERDPRHKAECLREIVEFEHAGGAWSTRIRLS
jgi:hypothetical protein